MNKNVVRIQTEMFKPGVIVRGPSLEVYVDPPSRSVWWPRQPRLTWLDEPDGIALRLEDGGFFFTFAALGTEINGRTNGDIDCLLQTRPAAELFRPDLPSFALMSRDRFESLLNQACWASLAIYEADAETGQIEYYAGLTLDELNAEDEATEGETS